MNSSTERSQRTVSAPLPWPILSNPPNRILSVVLSSDEDVQWIWAHTADGVSYVNGYTIVRKEAR